MSEHWSMRLRDLADAIEATGMQNMFVSAIMLRDVASHIDTIQSERSHWRKMAKRMEREIRKDVEND